MAVDEQGQAVTSEGQCEKPGIVNSTLDPDLIDAQVAMGTLVKCVSEPMASLPFMIDAFRWIVMGQAATW